MYRKLWDDLRGVIQPERMMKDVADIFELAQWSSFDKIGKLADLIAEKMRSAGMCDVEVISYPADGKTFYAGWVMPEACDVTSGTLEIAEPKSAAEVLFDYAQNPFALMLYSGGTGGKAVEADLVCVEEAGLDGGDVAGKVALVRGLNPRFAVRLFDAGAIGVIDDQMGRRPGVKDGPEQDDATQWNNYSLPPWKIARRGFGMSISPRQGERVRRLLGEGSRIRVRADVRVRRYEGALPVITGRLAGERDEEIFVTGHFDEPGADDNASGVAASIEAVRAIRELTCAGAAPPLRRSIRLIFAMEVRGLQALLATRELHKRLLLGVNADTVGSDQERATCFCSLGENFPSLPSFADDFLAELLRRVSEENPSFQYRRVPSDIIDNVCGEPLVGAPTPQLYHFTAHHHTNLDRPEMLSAQALADCCGVVGTYLLFLASADLREAVWLAQLAAEEGRKILANAGSAAERTALLAKYERKIDSVFPLVRGETYVPCAEEIERVKDTLLGEDRLTPTNFLLTVTAALKQALRTRASAKEKADAGAPASQEESCPEASRLVPQKSFLGFLGLEDLSEAEKKELEGLGVRVGWGAPKWLQHALFASSGKRTLADIARGVGGVDVRKMRGVFEFLRERGRVRFRPYIVKEDVVRLLCELGIARGDTLIAHSSLSEFGYIEGGADTLLDAFLEVVGREGTLLVPTFTFSWVGAPPYAPRETPSVLGTVPNVFWRREGVLRSRHPTHSFAAKGARAAHLLEGHDADMPPMAREGPIGKLVEVGGKILMFCRRGANSSMHAGEYWIGVPGVEAVCRVKEGGVTREVLVRGMPWHAFFDGAYELLFSEKRIRSAEFGEGTVHVMRAEDAIEAQSRAVRENPHVLLKDGCSCRYCLGVRAWIEGGAHRSAR